MDSSANPPKGGGGGPVRGASPKGTPRALRSARTVAVRTAKALHEVAARVVDESTQEPVSGARYELLSPEGKVIAQGKTDWRGEVREKVAVPGSYTVRVTPE